MRSALATSLFSLCLFGAVAGYSQLVSNTRYLQMSSLVLQDWAAKRAPVDSANLEHAAMERARLYDDLALQTHLVDGMVVNRGRGGGVIDECDSLLFSSLRFVGLTKLHMHDRAEAAWRGLETSRHDGKWVRHPLCRQKGTSRDMLLGLLVAFSQEPQGFDVHLRELVEQVRRSDGFFGDGPVYVSYLTPGIARLMAMLAPAGKLANKDLPPIIQDGYSTHEWTLYATRRGYEAHLVALTAWLDMELTTRHPALAERGPTLLEQSIGQIVSPFSHADLRRQRLAWTTYQLVRLDPRNLFFRYLRLRATGALTPPVAADLLGELLTMNQFPDSRLPSSCDRRADYLWQRASREFAPASGLSGIGCNREFNGVDYLWMAGLLVEALSPKAQAEAAPVAH